MALFGSPPSYEHLRVFGCACYPNTSATTPHKLSPRSTRCVFLGYSSDRKGYRCLDLSTNRLIVSRHVVFDEASFPLAASPHLTDLDFLCESGSSVNPIRTPLTTAGTTTAAACRPAPVVPPGFVPRVTPCPPQQSLRGSSPGRSHGLRPHHARHWTPPSHRARPRLRLPCLTRLQRPLPRPAWSTGGRHLVSGLPPRRSTLGEPRQQLQRLRSRHQHQRWHLRLCPNGLQAARPRCCPSRRP
jgi:hypothetical protein